MSEKNIKIFMLLMLVTIILFSFNEIMGWGKNGHRIIALTAQNHLTKKARDGVNRLLNGRSMAQISIWADEMYSVEKYSCASPFHYANIEEGKNYLTSKKNKKGAIIHALIFFEDILRNKKSSKEQKLISLKYLNHLIGDIHQPLHAGLACDYGGNAIKVKWFGQVINLHSVWDMKLIEFQQLSFTEFTDFLDRPSKKKIAQWQGTTYLDWFEESLALRKSAYLCYKKDNCFVGNFFSKDCSLVKTLKSDPPKLKYQYNHRKYQIIKIRLLQAGIRLAGVLNSIFVKSKKLSKNTVLMRKKIWKAGGKIEPVKECLESILEN